MCSTKQNKPYLPNLPLLTRHKDGLTSHGWVLAIMKAHTVNKIIRNVQSWVCMPA